MSKTHTFLTQIKAKASRLLTPEDQLFLYGSRARGDNDEYSDWDILIITRNKYTNDEQFEKFIYPLTLYGQEHNQEISVITYSKEEWEANNTSLFYKNVTKDRIRL